MTDTPELEPLGSRYLLQAPLGSGAMGQVWRAETRDGEPVAIKVLRPELSSDQGIVARFLQERHILQGIAEPHLVRMRDLVAEGDKLAIVMDLVEGPDLRTELGRRGTFAAAEAAEIVDGILAGLAAVHAAGVVHRDVKPENVLLAGSEPGGVRLTDFGVARIIEESQRARRTSVIGTPEYLAPELADGGDPSPASDLYAVGIVLYELVSGVTPFAGGSPLAVLRRHADQPPVRPEGMPDGIWETVVALLAKNPAERLWDAGAVRRRLEAAAPSLAGVAALTPLTAPPQPVTDRQDTVIRTRTETTPMTGAAVAAGPVAPPEPPAGRSRRGLLLALVAVLVVLLAGGGVTAFALTRGGGSTPAAATTTTSAAAGTTTDEATDTASATTTDSSAVVPNLVGQPLAQAQAALTSAGLQAVVKQVTDDTAPSGTVTAQDPAAGVPLAAGGPVTITVAQSTQGTYLSTLQPVPGGSQATVQAAALNGQTYAHAITADTRCGTPVALQYNLSRAYQQLTMTVGLSDDSNSAAVVQFDVLIDNKTVFSQTAHLGQALPVKVDVTNGLRLDIEATRVEKNCDQYWSPAQATAVWADGLLTGGPAAASPTS